MYILALETTGPKASAAIIDEKGHIADISGDELLSHLKSIMPMTQKLLERLGITMGDISAVAASRGPGSFTGIRIGVSAARALGQVLSVPCISVPTLETFRYNLKDLEGQDSGTPGSGATDNGIIICPVFDARRNQVYSGVYRDDQVLVPGGAYSLTELLDLLKQAVQDTRRGPEPIIFFGDGIDRYAGSLEAWARETGLAIRLAPEEIRYQQASSVAEMALQYYQEGRTVHYSQLKPEYMRLAEAERKLREQKLNG